MSQGFYTKVRTKEFYINNTRSIFTVSKLFIIINSKNL